MRKQKMKRRRRMRRRRRGMMEGVGRLEVDVERVWMREVEVVAMREERLRKTRRRRWVVGWKREGGIWWGRRKAEGR
jgi:hypothetical protein